MRFLKYQALGNDYLVLESAPLPPTLTPDRIQRICDRHYGVGSDGILLGPLVSRVADFGLRLFNPDGSEFEKSGNGLRIFARFLWDRGLVTDEPFTIDTPGGVVTAWVHSGGRRVTVDMGRVSFDSHHVPVVGPRREVIDEVLSIDGREFRFCAATVGNPHCVVLCQRVSARDAKRWGPRIETDARFPNRTNVQFMQVLDRTSIRIEIWERGAGYTLASGSSSCAAAAVAHRLNLCDAEVAVHVPGGVIDVLVGGDWSVRMSGGVTRVCEGEIVEEMFEV
jgi:diaminopimelate epimerase